MSGTVLVDWSGSSTTGAVAQAYWRRTAREAAMVAFTAVTLAFATNTLITEAVKTLSSKPRPSFFAQCDYKGFRAAQDSRNWSAYDAATQVNRAGDIADCGASSALITDAQASFPSGHSSISFVGCTFLSLWLGALSALWFGLEPWPWAWMSWTLRPWWASPVDAGFDKLWSGDRLGPGTPCLEECEMAPTAAPGATATQGGTRPSRSDGSSCSEEGLGGGQQPLVRGGAAASAAPESPALTAPGHASAALASAQEDFETAASIAALPYSAVSLLAQAAATLVVVAPVALATWVASSRVHDYKHHVYDTLAGGLIGMAVALVTWQWFVTAPAFVRWAALWQGARARHTGGQRAKLHLGVRSGVQHSALSGLMDRIA